MNPTDYIPHGIAAAFAGTIAFIFREHTKLDDERSASIATDLAVISTQQAKIVEKMANNHTEILKILLESERQAERRG